MISRTSFAKQAKTSNVNDAVQRDYVIGSLISAIRLNREKRNERPIR